VLHRGEEGLFRHDTEEVTGRWRRMHIEVRWNLYFPSYAGKVIKSCRLGWAGDVARMGLRDMFSDFGLQP